MPDAAGQDRLLDAVREALSVVYDPCSVAAGRPINIVDLGLVVSARVENDGDLVIVLRTTFPACTMAPHLVRAAEASAGEIVGVRSVRVEVDQGFTWSPSEIAPGAGDTPVSGRARPGVPVVPWALRNPRSRKR